MLSSSLIYPASTSYNQHNLWLRSLESVFENRCVFDAFHYWLNQNNKEGLLMDFPNCKMNKLERKLDALEVYLAIMAFHKCVAENDLKTKQMALALHRRFIRLAAFN